jgi:hypothetical protein
MESQITKRNQNKTSDGEFMFELLNGYELSPKESESKEDRRLCKYNSNIAIDNE